ncbi:hypothetical protein N9N67_04570 [Bacteriovoracaceae bacterium]|nr:hypothetical protein [Bacteriovoracaceae bacterium]
MHKIIYSCLIAHFFIFLSSESIAQTKKITSGKKVSKENKDTPKPDIESEGESETKSSFSDLKEQRLKRIHKKVVKLKRDLLQADKKLKAKKSSRNYKLVNRIKDELKIEQIDFIETLTSYNLDFHQNKVLPKKTFLEELQYLLEPVLNSLKRASQRPRKIEKIKKQLEDVKDKIDILEDTQTSLTNYKDVEIEEKDKKVINLTNSISSSKKIIEVMRSDLLLKKEDLQFQLLKLKNTGSLIEEISKMSRGFLRTKGKNLFLSLLAFFSLLWVFNLGKPKVLKYSAKFLHTIDDDGPHWAIRSIRVLYSFFAIFLSTLFAILLLYILNDWLLVTISVIIFGGVIWSTRNYLPQYVEQFKLLLNVGSVREGERIVYDGIPYLVKGIGIYCKIINPFLYGGELRVHSKTLLEIYSRPIKKKEPWFPTKTGNWVSLNDGTNGEVVMQTPETVILKLIGGEKKFYHSKEFLGMTPINLSENGFTIEIIFGIDYTHQPGITLDIHNLFEKELKRFIDKEIAASKVLDFKFEFAKANSSSLDFRFALKLIGSLAGKKWSLERKFQAKLVDLCNENQYVIPFNQLTVHHVGAQQ